jgi:DNA-binding CsgD family transcriptional regulator
MPAPGHGAAPGKGRAGRAAKRALPAVKPLAEPPWTSFLRDTPPPTRDRKRSGPPAGALDDCVHSFLPMSGRRIVACITLARARRPFKRVDREVVHLLHSELSWVYEADLLLASPDALELSPRQRETLQHLLAGLGEKQIATRLGLSPNTVHHYVKALYRHFGVSSRSELLARWVRNEDAVPAE